MGKIVVVRLLSILFFGCLIGHAGFHGQHLPSHSEGFVDIAAVTAPVQSWTRYHSYNQTNSMVQELFNLSASHPDICRVFSIGRTWQGRDIWIVKISDNVSIEENEPGVWYDGLHHAREWLTTELCLYIIHKLVDEYGINSTITQLVNERQIWVVPMLNPDGRVYDGINDGIDPKNTNNWRKNCRDNNNNGIFEHTIDGVDLNRNYGYQWCTGGSSPETGSEVYMGPEPFSEPETRAVRDFIRNHSISVYISYHTFTQIYLYPWAWTAKECRDHAVFKQIAQNMLARTTNKASSHYPYREGPIGSAMYICSGDSGDWVYGERGIIALGAELYPDPRDYYVYGEPAVSPPYDPFHPREDKILPVCEDNIEPAIYLAQIADNPYRVVPYHFNLRAVSTDIIAFPAQLQTVQVLLENNGMNGDSYVLSTSALTGWSLQLPSTLSLSPGTAQFLLNLTPPATAAGTYTLYLNASSQNNTAVNDTLKLRITVPQAHDTGVVQIANFSFGGIYPLGYHNISVTMRNMGYSVENSVNTKLEIRKLQTTAVSQLLFEDNFDAGAKGWVSEYSNIEDWQCGPPTYGTTFAHSPPNCYGTNLAGTYPDNANDWLISPEFVLPVNASSITLSFWHWYSFHYYPQYNYYDDYGYLRLYENGVWCRLKSYKGRGGGWMNENIDLSKYRGKTIRIAFQLSSDGSDTAAGWYVDDVRLIARVHPEIVVFENMKSTVTPLDFGAEETIRWNYLFVEEAEYRLLSYTMLPNDMQNSNNATELLIEIRGGSLNMSWRLPLSPGWQFVSIPLNITEPDIRSLLVTIDGCYERIEYYDATDMNDHWKIFSPYSPSYLNDLSIIDNRKGFWILITRAAELNLTAPVPQKTVIGLKKGWNMIGYPKLFSEKVKDVFSSITPLLLHVQGFDENEKYRLKELMPDDNLQPGAGYWVQVSADCTLAIP